MCRNIKPLYNFEPPVTEEDIRLAALQFVRKVSGFTHPSRANEAAFQASLEAVTDATKTLLDSLATSAPPKDRALEIARARERGARRFARGG